MHSFRLRLLSIALCVMICIAVALGDLYPKYTILPEDDTIYEEGTSITVWFTDSYLEEYLRNAAVVYEEQTGVKVIPTCVSSLEYLEAIQKATIDDNYGPDVFLLDSESLEKAYLSGLCCSVEDPNRVLNSAYYPMIALNAVSYGDKKLGYPILFESSLFVYNRTLLEEIAEMYNQGLDEGKTSDYGEGVVEAENPEGVEEVQHVTADEIIPTSIVGIIEFALKYDMVEGMQSYFKWCVSDVLYDYWFSGAYMDVGGIRGDERSEINIYSEESVYCLEVFQDFKQFFSMEIDESSYEDILQEFKDGKLLFMVADTDIINELETSKVEENGFAYEYGVANIGMLNDNLKSKGLSVTTLAAVNGFSKNTVVAEDFAKFISYDYSENTFSRTGKMPCKYMYNYQYPQMEDVMRTYENSVSLPKIVETSNFWVLVEMVYTKTWDGDNANYLLRQLSSQVKKQVYGIYVDEEAIETPEILEDYVFQ